MIKVYTDGGCSKGKGGYGIVIKEGDTRTEYSKGFYPTTNNRMELMAVVEALKIVGKTKEPVLIKSDSRYVINPINQKWLYKWRRNNFKDIKNVDLWLRILEYYDPKIHEFMWIKGHSVTIENNRCDALATLAYKTGILEKDEGFFVDKRK